MAGARGRRRPSGSAVRLRRGAGHGVAGGGRDRAKVPEGGPVDAGGRGGAAGLHVRVRSIRSASVRRASPAWG
eukprot:scaffold12648_cov45-Isochrysis_galbana.AAC.1